MTALRRSHVRARTHRLIASRYPTLGAFDDLSTDRDELAIAFLLESVTNDRLALISRRLALVPISEIVQGPGATMVMAAFLHADEAGGRFTDGRLGAWYASFDVETAIAETLHHSTRRLRHSERPFPSSIQLRELIARVDCELVEIRGEKESRPELYNRDDYAASQAFGTRLRWPASQPGENGFVYDSVRHAGGTNVCIYRPPLINLPVKHGNQYEYRWDASGRANVFKLTNANPDRSPSLDRGNSRAQYPDPPAFISRSDLPNEDGCSPSGEICRTALNSSHVRTNIGGNVEQAGFGCVRRHRLGLRGITDRHHPRRCEKASQEARSGCGGPDGRRPWRGPRRLQRRPQARERGPGEERQHVL